MKKLRLDFRISKLLGTILNIFLQGEHSHPKQALLHKVMKYDVCVILKCQTDTTNWLSQLDIRR